MEFGFADTVTSKRRRKGGTRKSSAELRAGRLAQTKGVPEKGPPKSAVDTPGNGATTPGRRIDWTNPPGVLGNEWIDGVCANIRSARDLREAVALSACYLTDLIDCEIEVRGHNEAWKQEYEAYCWTHYFSLTVETETELEELRALWWGAGIILSTESGSTDRSDWELFEDLGVFEVDLEDPDSDGAEASYMEFLALLLSNLHGHLLRANCGTFTEPLRPSKP